jgi:hypothetical protein
MWLTTKLGFFSIIQKVPPDDGDAAVYHVCATARGDLENLLHALGFQRNILISPDADSRYRITAIQQEIFEILGVLTDTVDYDSLEAALTEIPSQRGRVAAWLRNGPVARGAFGRQL